MADLSALFEEVDSKPAFPLSPPLPAATGTAVLPAEAHPPPAGEPRPVRSASLPDLSFSQSEDNTESLALNIPAELEKLLSPDLWRKLNGTAPARGVLVNVLERVRSVLYLLSTYLPSNLVQEKMRRPVAGLVGGQMVRGTLLFSDVSGFTALSERLAVLGPEGAERLTAIMNRYFATMLEILAWSGGILLKFAGDATLVYFPEQEGGQQANWAVRAGLRMLRAMSGFTGLPTPTEKVTLRMKVGVATGTFLASSIGTARRMEYCVLGEAVSQTMGAEGAATAAGQLVVNQATLASLEPIFIIKTHKAGYALVDCSTEQALDDFEIKAEARRARGAIPWSASPQAIMAQVEVAQRQIQALQPFLATELVERIVVNVRQRRVESEYRPATVLFCNFSGPEALLDRWGEGGAGRVTSLLSAYFTAMNEVITRYGGIVSRMDPYSKGTKMLVLFGAPVAHEDDPQRAVTAALAMNVELDTLNEEWLRKFARYLPPGHTSPLIQHRIGITYGETFAGQVGSTTRREYTVMGDDVNLSARLMGAADMGQILLSERVQEAVSEYFMLTALTSIRVKGKSKPIPIFQVDGPREDTLLKRVHSRGPLIGRESELEWGKNLLIELQAGRGQVACLTGPAGMGKSHLADTLLQLALASHTTVLLEQCRSYAQETPFAPWSALLRELAGITANDFRPQAHLEKLEALFQRLRLPESSIPALLKLAGVRGSEPQWAARQTTSSSPGGVPVGELAAAESRAVEGPAETSAPDDLLDFIKKGRPKRRSAGMEFLQKLEEQNISETGQVWQAVEAPTTERARRELFEALGSLLSQLAAEAPALVFLEDAHYLDPYSLDFLHWLKDEIRQAPVLVLLAQRSSSAGEAAPALPPWPTMNLQPLDPAGTAALVSHLLVTELAQVIHEQSLGNPLFVEEITRWFQRTRNLSAGELKSVLQTSDVLQKLVLSGVESLPVEQREIIRLAAVIGMEFRTGEVQALLPDGIDPVSLSNHLRGLVKARLISLAEAGADARYIFQQSLARDVLYKSMPFEQRRELHGKLATYLELPLTTRRAVHARIAAALESHSPSNAIAAAERAAFHYEQAQQWLPAARSRVRGGQEAHQQQAWSRAAALFAQSLSDLEQLGAGEAGSLPEPDAGSLRFQACLHLGSLGLETGDYNSAVTYLEAAREVLSRQPELGSLLDLAARLALALAPLRKAAEAAEQLRAALEAEPPTAFAAAVMAWLEQRLGGDPQCWREQVPGLLGGDASRWGAGVRVLMEDLAGNREAAVQGYLAIGKPEGAALAHLHLGEAAAQQRNPEAALAHYQQAAEIWKNAPVETCGLALALYRQAEAYWQVGKDTPARLALEFALQAMPGSGAALHIEGPGAIVSAIKLVDSSGSPGAWPTWRGQLFEDNFCIAMLIQPLAW